MRSLSVMKRLTALAMALMFLVASNVTRVEAAPANTHPQEEVEAIIRNMYDKFAAFDAQATTDCFAADGTIEDSVGTTPIQGTEAILAYQQSFPSLLQKLRFQSVDITVGGQEAAVKWRIRLRTRTGNVFFLEGIGILKVNEDWKIQSARNFFDLAYFQSQLMQ